MNDPVESTELLNDVVLRAMIASRDARGRLARLGPTLDRILANHDYPPVLEKLLAEALVLTALFGSLLKDPNGQLTMQAQTENGIIDLLVCDYKAGELRGYIRHDPVRLAEGPADPNLFSLFGKGYLAITFDLAGGKGRYQGIVPLEGDSLTEACERYFYQSEQVPTLIRCAVRSDGDGVHAAGLLVQHLPEGEEGRERLHAKLDHPEWEHVAILAGSLRHEELLDPDLSLEAIAWRLFHEEEEVRIQSGAEIGRGCRCSVEHYREVLERFPEEQRVEMRDENGIVLVDCAFCSKQFGIEV